MCLDLRKSIRWLRPRLECKTIYPLTCITWATVSGLLAFNSRILLWGHFRISHLSGDFRWGCCSSLATLEYLHPRTWPVCTAVAHHSSQSEKTSPEQVSGWKNSTSQHSSRPSFQSVWKTSPEQVSGWKIWTKSTQQLPVILVSLKKHHRAGTGDWVKNTAQVNTAVAHHSSQFFL